MTILNNSFPPHLKVAPTIRGVVDGRDEIFEAAVKYLQKNLKQK
jgi:hypothetical protein